MNIRLTHIDDLQSLETIISKARKYLKDNNVDQWQDFYPDKEFLQSSIQNNTLLVLDEDTKILGMMNLSFSEDKDYNIIEQGRWLSDYDYGVIHTLAIDMDYSGNSLSSKLIEFAIAKCRENNIRSLRIDTHYDNKTMKSILKKHKFIKCGQITLSKSGAKRDAYEKIVIDFVKGDIISLKKNHPCGNNIFEIEKLGMDFRLKCITCQSTIRLDRIDVKRRLKKRLTKEEISKLSKES